LSETKPVTEAGGRGTRSIPKIVLTDAEAGAAVFAGSDSRSYNYFEPKGRRASRYEDVTVDVQPDPERWLSQSWLYGWPNGDLGYDPRWTRIRTSDWHRFRDPNEEWERTIYINNSNSIRQVQHNIEFAKSENVFEDWNKSWIPIISKHLSAWAHADYGLGMYVFMPAQRAGMTNMHNNAISVNSMHKLRTAQDIMLYNMELTDLFPSEFDGEVHQEIWLNDPAWQGVRENVERLMNATDWVQLCFASNIVFEPLVGELLRRQFITRFAPPHNDFLTPALMSVSQREFADRDLRYTLEMMKDFLGDETHGQANRQVMQEWLAKWVPYSVRAARGLEPIWSEPEVQPISFEDSFGRVRSRFEGIVSDLQLQLPQEVNL
jgi:propane monooxygenase small subunit